MQSQSLLNRILTISVALCFVWFFASSMSIAYQKSLQHDDAMFATIPKNFLEGQGWSTLYGEKIPFNPDVSTGPTLWIPAALMIKAFGNQVWVPAMTGTLTNILLTVLVLWQLHSMVRNQASAAFALLLSISLFSVSDFKSFSAYYTAGILFLFSLLFALNPRHKKATRLLLFGAFSAVGLYAKPLILLSYLAAIPFVVFSNIVFCNQADRGEKLWRYIPRALAMLVLGFMMVFSPWYMYKNSILAHESPAYRAAYNDYGQQFFEFHGSGIGQFAAAQDKLAHLKRNTVKNYYILKDFLQNEMNFPFAAMLLVITISLLITLQYILQCYSRLLVESSGQRRVEILFISALSIVLIANLFWFVVFSFAMTPGHAFFLVFFSIFLFFFLLATQVYSSITGVILCSVAALLFQVRHSAVVEAYGFKATDLYVSNQNIIDTANFITQHELRYPLASCGWHAGPWVIEFVMAPPPQFLDCFNVLEDSLVLDEQDYIARNPDINLQVDGRTLSPTEHFFTQGMHNSVKASFHWQSTPGFTLAVEVLSMLNLVQSTTYIVKPIIDSCEKHIVFQAGGLAVCEVLFDEYSRHLDPTEMARKLVLYQSWYRTRIRVY